MNRNHFLFDVDGTLTPSRKRIQSEFALWFMYFAQQNPVSLVTGSDNPKTVEHLGVEICKSVNKCYNCNGYDIWEIQKNVYSNNNYNLCGSNITYQPYSDYKYNRLIFILSVEL